MPTVGELTALYSNFLLAPRPGPDVCEWCFNFTHGYDRCFACSHGEQHFAAIAPISYSVAHEQLHHALAGYKRLSGEIARRLTIELAAVLWRHLAMHEHCVADEASVERFQLVTTIPSGDAHRDERHPLRQIVAELVAPTRDRHERLLRRSDHEAMPRRFDPAKFEPTRRLSGESILLIDDTWTTGASAQSAAAALRAAGSGPLGVVVIGRHLNRHWHENDRRLRGIARPFVWNRCALCENGDRTG
jgi:predicted amidophosphoribosyltransferase